MLAWALWPRRYPPNLHAGPGEHVLNAFLKIAEDGRITVAVGQAEMGQGVYTALPQILADELGADWRTIGVEPAPIHPLFANRLLAEEAADEALPHFLRGVGGWAARRIATASELIITAGSTSIRAFEAPFRDVERPRARCCAWRRRIAGRSTGRPAIPATASSGARRRQAAFRRAGRRCGRQYAAGSAAIAPDRRWWAVRPFGSAARCSGQGRWLGALCGRRPAAGYAVRFGLPGPTARSRLSAVDKPAAAQVRGVVDIVENPGWAAAIATNWWAADRAARALRPRYETPGRSARSGQDRAHSC